jgi:molybdate transport system substrate-binding protein
VAIESVGGVDAAKRVQAGEAFDVVCWPPTRSASSRQRRIVDGSVTDLVRSGVAIAVPRGAARPDYRQRRGAAPRGAGGADLGYSTGPSGVALQQLFARWGIAEAIQSRLVQAPPGVAVGSLVARGEVALGFQQLSELMHLDGIEVVGPMPPGWRSSRPLPARSAAHATHPTRRARCSTSSARPPPTKRAAATACSRPDLSRTPHGDPT